jgi:REP element-mobilizing transposase RayT
MHITLRRRRDVPSFRQELVRDLVIALIREKREASFQIVHFSIQRDHVHLVAEGGDAAKVRRGVSRFTIAFAKRLNGLLGRKRGKVWGDRYHRRDVRTSSEMRTVLRYVFGNAKKHGLIPRTSKKLDPYSSAIAFEWWDVPLPDHPLKAKIPRVRPRTQLLGHTFLYEPLRLDESPIGNATRTAS